MEADVQLNKALVVVQRGLCLRHALVQIGQILVGAALGGPRGDGGVVALAVFVQLGKGHLTQLDHVLQRLLGGVKAQLLHHRAGGALGGGDVSALLQPLQGFPDGGAAALQFRHHGPLRGQPVAGLQRAGGDEGAELLINIVAGPLGRIQLNVQFVGVHCAASFPLNKTLV